MPNNAIIFGDSYSTFKDFIPEGYATYYPQNATDVTEVSETWWHQVVTETNLNLILNDSWSGSTIGYTGYNNNDCSQTSSFIFRLKKLTESGFFQQNKIDTVFVFGGTNDNWSNAPLGTEKYENWEDSDLYSVLPAISYFFKTLKDTVPNADIYCLINTNLKPEILGGLKNACKKYGITDIAFEKIDKAGGHPTVKGMQDIKNKVLENLNIK